MKKTILLLSTAFGIATASIGTAQILAEFGNTSSNLFTLVPDSNIVWTPSQTASGISISGNDNSGNQFGGSWSNPWTLSSNSGLKINITGSLPNPGSVFTVTLFSTDFNETKEFQGSFAEPSVVDNNYALSFQTESSSFASIGGFTLTSGGPGTSLSVSVNNLNTVPEPGTYALMAIAGVAWFAFARRRKALA